MHIPDGFLDPKVSAGMMGIAAVVLGISLAKVRQAVTALQKSEVFAAVANTGANLTSGGRRVLSKFGAKILQKMFFVIGLVFFAQMFDFIGIEKVTGHLMGGAMAGIVLGPFAGMVAMSAVVISQMLFMGDGGAFALGVNLFNIAIVGVFSGYYIYSALKRVLYENVAIFSAAWLSVVFGALSYTLLISFFGIINENNLFQEVMKVHVVVGLAEGLFTVAFVEIFRRYFK